MIDNKLVLNDSSSVEFQEAFNILRTNLSFALSGKKNKIIALTCTDKKENPGTVALNLAISFSQIESNKVLLVDGDMHSSALSVMLEQSGKEGFSECLSGNAVKENSIVSLNGIDFLPSGKTPSNPANLLGSATAQDLCQKLKNSYDYVFVVLPPVNLWSDASIFAKFADGFLPVVRHKFTKFKEIDTLLKNLRIADGKILGFVYNNAPYKRKK